MKRNNKFYTPPTIKERLTNICVDCLIKQKQK